MRSLRSVLKSQRGASLVEYGMLVFLIAVVCLAAVTGLGTAVQAAFTAITTALTPAT